VRCPACKNENPRYPKVPYCDVCGVDLNPPKRETVFEPAVSSTPNPTPAPAAPINAHQKRRTVFEPGVGPSTPAAPSNATSPPAADFFAHPPPPRPPLNPTDPFSASSGMAPPSSSTSAAGLANGQASAALGQNNAPRKAKTVINPAVGGGGNAAAKLVRGALFEYRGPGDPGRVHAVREGRNVIGRDNTCEIALDDGRISSQHAFLFLRAEDATFLDVSTNGSRVDGKVVSGEQVVLRHGSTLELGDTFLVFALVPETVLSNRGPTS
jgi:hypothetical protein